MDSEISLHRSNYSVITPKTHPVRCSTHLPKVKTAVQTDIPRPPRGIGIKPTKYALVNNVLRAFHLLKRLNIKA